MSGRRLYLGALLIAALLPSGAGASRSLTRPQYAQNADFRVTRLSAYLGTQARSRIEIRGLIGGEASANGLTAHVDFEYTVLRTCRAIGNPLRRTVVRQTLRWKTSADWVPRSELPAGAGPGDMTGWAKRYSFALPEDPCPDGYKPEPISIRKVNLTAWPGSLWSSPPPGIPSCDFQLRSGWTRMAGNLSRWCRVSEPA